METRACQNCKKDFTIEADDFSFYEKIKVPPPTFCPDCRRQRRMARRNDIYFYKRKCDLTGIPIISIYSLESGISVFAPKVWNGDGWNALDYGRDYDFSRPFFEQYNELLRSVPKPSTDTDDGIESTNCMYTNDFAMGKNCYLVIKAWKLEDVMYSFYVIDSKDLIDVHTSFGKDEGNYETVNTEHCYQCRYVYDSQSCSDSAFCYDCRNCDNCFMCTGLRGKSYCFQNQEVGKERYREVMKEYALHTYLGVQKAQREFEPILQKHPRKALRMVNCKDCLGDLVYNSHDCKYCFVTANSEHYKYGSYSDGIRDSYDTDAGGGSELVYESGVTAFCSQAIGNFWSWYCRETYYVEHCRRSNYCFGCSGLKDQQYCILNKQYTKEEYFKLVSRIKQHMIDMPYIDKCGRTYTFGDYLPVELSYFPYNETEAYEIIPLSKTEAIENSFLFNDKDQNIGDKETIRAQDLPDSIDNVDDSMLNEVILSKFSNRKFKITQPELSFYRKYKIPLPRESFFERHARRHKIASSFKLYDRKSDKSGDKIVSSYPSEATEIVWSIEEYKKEFE